MWDAGRRWDGSREEETAGGLLGDGDDEASQSDTLIGLWAAPLQYHTINNSTTMVDTSETDGDIADDRQDRKRCPRNINNFAREYDTSTARRQTKSGFKEF